MRSIRLPDEWAPRARDIIEGRIAPAASRDAATVILLRDVAGPGGGIEAYMLRRKSTMAFAPGAHVFPGGSVDPRDADHALRWAGPEPAEWARAFGTSPALARELVCAAVRETFEESGVLLAGPAPDTVVADTRDESYEHDRLALIDRTVSLAELLDRRGLVLRSDLLRPWSHWITPELEKRRFDTRFFVAALPRGQRTRDVGGEADQVAWLDPREAIEAARRREIALMPPTAGTLDELRDYRDVAAVLAAAPGRLIEPRMPSLAFVDEALHLVLPEELDYPGWT